MKKICFIISDVDRVLMFEWMSVLLQKNYRLYFIILNNRESALERFLKENKFDHKVIRTNGKKHWLKAATILYKTLRKEKPDIVHCHFYEANILGLTAARLAGVKSRVYTRHYSSLHHVYFKKGLFWDNMCNRLATRIVAISKVVYTILVSLENVPREKVVTIPHALLSDDFSSVEEKRIKNLREKFQIPGSAYVIGVISRLTEWKGVQYTIPAFKEFLKIEPNALLLLLNARGDYESQVNKLLEDIPESNVRLIKFESDIQAAYKLMDVFIHVPIDNHSEAFGLTYIESLAAQVPAIFTLSGVAPEFIENEKNALVVPFKDSETIYESLIRIRRDVSLANRLKNQGANDVKKQFSFNLMMSRLNNLYASL